MKILMKKSAHALVILIGIVVGVSAFYVWIVGYRHFIGYLALDFLPLALLLLLIYPLRTFVHLSRPITLHEYGYRLVYDLVSIFKHLAYMAWLVFHVFVHLLKQIFRHK